MENEHGFVVVIYKSEVSKKKHIYWITKKGGKEYKQYKDKLVCKFTGIKKCRCPFKLKGRFVRTIDSRVIV